MSLRPDVTDTRSTHGRVKKRIFEIIPLSHTAQLIRIYELAYTSDTAPSPSQPDSSLPPFVNVSCSNELKRHPGRDTDRED